MTKTLSQIVTNMGYKFTFRSSLASYAEVFSPTGILPGLAKRADQLCSLCLGYGIGAKFEQLQGSPLGIKVTFDDHTPSTLRYLCIIDVINEIAKNAKDKNAVPLDELIYD
jgi:intracellular multiplication protein IcmS